MMQGSLRRLAYGTICEYLCVYTYKCTQHTLEGFVLFFCASPQIVFTNRYEETPVIPMGLSWGIRRSSTEIRSKLNNCVGPWSPQKKGKPPLSCFPHLLAAHMSPAPAAAKVALEPPVRGTEAKHTGVVFIYETILSRGDLQDARTI